jgi:arylsulfatase A
MKIITNLFLLLIPYIVQCAERPNIVFILSDDIGTGDIKCYYEPSKVTTPNIDNLATQGMRFTQAYAPVQFVRLHVMLLSQDLTLVADH